ncbi:hypothetical protein TKK_0018517 [Trichogramma kaykai]|uniref:Uncharacterized protein n=1 Tax=Trichogramma kaykai TaxID=54128 RepID=A0ABD2VZJ1_9HYME
MPHCTSYCGWYLSKFFLGLTGMLFFYFGYLKETGGFGSGSSSKSCPCPPSANANSCCLARPSPSRAPAREKCYREGARKVAAAVPETNSRSIECKDDSTTDFDTCEGAPAAEFTCQCQSAKQRSSRSVSSSNRVRPAKDRRKKRRSAVYRGRRCDGKPIPRRLSLGSTSFEENTPSSSSSCEALPIGGNRSPLPVVPSARSRHCGDCGGSDHYQTIEQMQLNFEKTLRDLDALNRSFTDECRTESDGKPRKRDCGDSFDSSKRVRLATPSRTTIDPGPATDETIGRDTDQCCRVRRNQQPQSNQRQCDLRKKVNLCEEHHRCFRKIHAAPS